MDQIANILPYGLVLVDNTGCVLEHNNAFAVLFPSAEVGMDIKKLFHENVIDQFMEIFNGSKTGTILTADGPLAINIMPLPPHTLIEVKHEQISQTEHQTNAALRMVAHEIRTHLTTIRGMAEIAVKKPSAAARGLLAIITSSQQLLETSENILNRAKLQTGNISIQLSPINPTTILKIARVSMDLEAKKKGLEITIEPNPDVPNVVLMDTALFQTVINNLVSNAVKYTEKGGITVKAFVQNDRLGVSVRDTGRGISEKRKEYLFTEFQHDKIREENSHGIGIGLYIVKELVTHLKGKLTFHSEESKGTEFIVTIPLVLP